MKQPSSAVATDVLAQLAFSSATDPLVVLDSDGRIVAINAAAVRESALHSSGSAPADGVHDQLIGHPLPAGLPPERLQALASDDRHRLVRILPGRTVANPNGKPPEETSARLLAILERSPDLISTATPDGRLLYMNPAARRLLEIRPDEDIRQRTLPMHHPRWAYERIRDEGIPTALREGEWMGETAVLLPNGQELAVSQLILAHRGDSGQVEYLSTIASRGTVVPLAPPGVRDLSDRLRVEKALQEAQRLEALAVLAGGVSHTFNNLMTTVLGYASLASGEAGLSPSVRTCLQQIEGAARQAAEVCRRLLAHAGRGQVHLGPIDFDSVVGDHLTLLRLMVPPAVELSLRPAGRLPPVQADVNQIGQVIVYLVTNAVEAHDGRGGQVVVRTGLARLDEHQLAGMRIGPGLPAGDYVFLEVSDTGCGMDDGTQARMFEPFFSTKFTGRGLGLSAVHGIVRAHKGALEVHSRPGQGTTFRLYFPCPLVEPPTAGGPATAEVPNPQAEGEVPWQSWGKVLVADDEEGVRQFACTVLGMHGLETLEAADGLQALGILEEHRAEIRLALLDLTMPHLDGKQTLEEVRRRWPDLPVVLMSGYGQKELGERRLLDLGLAAFLPKPFTPNRLAATIRDILMQEG